MPNEQLLAHIRSELARGVDAAAITPPLLAAGWKIDDINAALASVAPAPSQNIPIAPQTIITSTQAAYATPIVSPQSGSLKTVVQDSAARIFIACVSILTIVSILGVWSIFSNDVIAKSFETLGLLAFVAVVVIVASKFVGDPSVIVESVPNPAYRAIRNITLASLIVSATLLALFGVLSIWEVITDRDILTNQ